MDEETVISKLNQAIQTGERARVLFETLLSMVGLDIMNPDEPGKLFQRLHEVQTDYEAAVNDMRLILLERHKQNKFDPANNAK